MAVVAGRADLIAQVIPMPAAQAAGGMAALAGRGGVGLSVAPVAGSAVTVAVERAAGPGSVVARLGAEATAEDDLGVARPGVESKTCSGLSTSAGLRWHSVQSKAP